MSSYVVAGAIALTAWTCLEAVAEDAEMRIPAPHTRAYKSLDRLGYRQIRIVGVAWEGCDKDDSLLSSKRFTALPPVHTDSIGPTERVAGVVCCGFVLLGCEVRFP